MIQAILLPPISIMVTAYKTIRCHYSEHNNLNSSPLKYFTSGTILALHYVTLWLRIPVDIKEGKMHFQERKEMKSEFWPANMEDLVIVVRIIPN
jgi:hypothetical protein